MVHKAIMFLNREKFPLMIFENQNITSALRTLMFRNVNIF
jgi:hypothetical protein